MTLYSLDSVSKDFHAKTGTTRALQGLELTIRHGEELVLLGPSGSGKSTLLRLLNRTFRPTTGTVLFNGTNLESLHGSRLREAKNQIGMVYQQHFLVPSLSVLSNVLSGALGRWSTLATIRNYVQPEKRVVQQAAEVLSSVGLANRINDRVSELSGGQQQRVAIARMLMQNPTVMLADEPISSLDPNLAEETIELLRTLARTSSRTLILSTHNVELALRSSARVIFLSHGRLILDSQTSSLDRQSLKEIYKLASVRQEPLAWKPAERPRSRKQCVC